jgi:hypothetical protein
VSITIEGVPAAVTREQVCASIRALGIDPSEVCGLSFGETAVHVEVYGSQRPAAWPPWRWTSDGKAAATHRLTIPIVNEEPG